jgi:hypothetical protein
MNDATYKLTLCGHWHEERIKINALTLMPAPSDAGRAPANEAAVVGISE